MTLWTKFGLTFLGIIGSIAFLVLVAWVVKKAAEDEPPEKEKHEPDPPPPPKQNGNGTSHPTPKSNRTRESLSAVIINKRTGFSRVFMENTTIGRKTLRCIDSRDDAQIRLREADLRFDKGTVYIIPVWPSTIKLDGKTLLGERETKLPFGTRILHIGEVELLVKVKRR